MLRRELAIALRARITWVQAALAALLVGHGFLLAVDLFTSGARSVKANVLMAREFDPLLGIVRPTLGGLYLAASLLGPIVAARGLSVERERNGLAALLLQTGAPLRVVLSKYVASLCAIGLQLLAPLLLLLVWRAVGGHLALAETATALLGYTLYLALIAALAVAAAAWTRTLAQAVAVGLLLVAASWAIDASEGFAALAWLGRALDWSVTTHLEPLERGTFAVAACAWLIAATLGALACAYVGLRSDLAALRRGLAVVAAVAGTLGGCALAARIPWSFDFTEEARASLPPAAIAGLRAIGEPIQIEIVLDRDDARRRQMELDVLAKLRLARPDLDVRTPLDARSEVGEADRDEGYGRIVLRVGATQRETFSTSRREVVTLLFEAAGRPAPDWAKRDYPGYPLVVSGARRTAIVVAAYFALPLGLAAIGWWVTRSRRRSA